MAAFQSVCRVRAARLLPQRRDFGRIKSNRCRSMGRENANRQRPKELAELIGFVKLIDLLE
jgi:hypothetical protein